MSESDLKELIKKELKWWYWIISVIIIVVIFASNMLSNKLFYEDTLQKLQEKVGDIELKHEKDISELKNITGILGVYVIQNAAKTGVNIIDNPFAPKK